LDIIPIPIPYDADPNNYDYYYDYDPNYQYGQVYRYDVDYDYSLDGLEGFESRDIVDGGLIDSGLEVDGDLDIEEEDDDDDGSWFKVANTEAPESAEVPATPMVAAAA
jgi:hypothetical protein